MKQLITAAAIALMACSCTAQQNPYTINGTWNAGNEGDTVYLVINTSQGMTPVNSATIRDHKFSLQNNAETITFVSVYGFKAGQPVASAQPVFVLDGARVNVSLDNGKAYGEPNNDLWNKINEAEIQLAESNKAILQNQSPATKRKRDSISALASQIYVDGIMNNMPLPICGLLAGEMRSTFSESQLTAILSAMDKKMPNDPYYKKLKAQREADALTAVGNKYREIAMVDVKGNMKRLSEVVSANKVTLIDFWASWCRPCLMEMPNVKNIYNMYHDKGLEVYGVSLDEDQLAWQGAIERFQLPWIHVSDLKGWSSSAAQSYNIKGIPATVLIDQNGTIIGKNLRGSELKEAIEKALK